METAAHRIIMNLFLYHGIFIGPDLHLRVSCDELGLAVDLLLNVEVHYVFTLCANSQLNLGLGLLVSDEAHDLGKLDLHAGPTSQPVKVFLVSIILEKMHPPILCTSAEVIIAVCCQARIHWRHFILTVFYS